MSSSNPSKQEKIRQFNPDGVGSTTSGIFGLPFEPEEADVVIIPVPWDVTVSNLEGTCKGPENVFEQSSQIDLFDEFVADPWKAGIAMLPIPDKYVKLNSQLRPKALQCIQWLEEQSGDSTGQSLHKLQQDVNEGCAKLEQWVFETATGLLQQNKLAVVLGGDHSSPLGLMRALSHRYEDFGVLHIDAHADLRPAYEGFVHSHASIMYNAMALPQISKFVQVGLRDYCSQEQQLMANNPQRFSPYFARQLHQRLFEGQTWKQICLEMIAQLPQNVYISFDIDGLDPAWCPSTGTPVPGGLSYNQVLYLFELLSLSGKTIVGFDLVETGPDTLDGIISCRILYRTLAMMLKTQNRI